MSIRIIKEIVTPDDIYELPILWRLCQNCKYNHKICECNIYSGDIKFENKFVSIE